MAAVAVATMSGCVSMDDGRGTMLGPYRPGHTETQVNEAARIAFRLEQAEASIRRLQAQVDSMAESQHRLSAQAESQLEQARREARAARSELDSLKGELAAVSSEQKQIRGTVDALPGKITKAIAAATPPAPAPRQTRASAVGYEHKVEAGQTLSEIARAYGVRMDAIVRENKLKDAGSIRVGQVLFIPK